MTAPVDPGAAPEISVYPALGSANFNQEAYDYATSMRPASVRLGELAQATHTNAVSAGESADIANSAALAAATSQEIALAASTFKGLWTSLSGPLDRPACVKHAGRFWLLNADLANVAASEPGVSSDWISIDSGSVAQDVYANATMIPGVLYVVKVANITLSLPNTLSPGDRFAVADASAGGFLVNWNTHTVKGETPEAPMRVPALRGFEVTYSGSTLA